MSLCPYDLKSHCASCSTHSASTPKINRSYPVIVWSPLARLHRRPDPNRRSRSVMGLLDQLWDDTVAGPRPETGLGRLRKHSSFGLRSNATIKVDGCGGDEAEGAAAIGVGGSRGSEGGGEEVDVRVTRSIMMKRAAAIGVGRHRRRGTRRHGVRPLVPRRQSPPSPVRVLVFVHCIKRFAILRFTNNFSSANQEAGIRTDSGGNRYRMHMKETSEEEEKGWRASDTEMLLLMRFELC
ncbi:hypothetical protein BHE74_00032163 [Ensete ventricosum]|nr:hypothetical protein BHE74_00032163 [Ensete ventricosum]